MAAALDHPGILPIYEVGAEYCTMRFAEVGSLAERIEWFRDPRTAAELVARVADAVQHAHERGILHRDLKPGNILLASRTEPLVSDFGLARWLHRDGDATASLTVLGTPDYLAPEMLRGVREGSTTAADVFSLGAILYYLLAGRAPFAGESVAEVLRRVAECAEGARCSCSSKSPAPISAGRWMARDSRSRPSVRCASSARKWRAFSSRKWKTPAPKKSPPST